MRATSHVRHARLLVRHLFPRLFLSLILTKKVAIEFSFFKWTFVQRSVGGAYLIPGQLVQFLFAVSDWNNDNPIINRRYLLQRLTL
jgi:hypothetical protein